VSKYAHLSLGGWSASERFKSGIYFIPAYPEGGKDFVGIPNPHRLAPEENKVRMAQPNFSPKPHTYVLLRVFDIPGHGMTPALAQSILALDFPEGDAARIDELNGRANEGELTAEGAELETCININDLLAYWQSKARQTLQPPA
jgi:hypothetical protein